MLFSPLLHVHFTSGPWRKSCTEFTPHGPTLITSVFGVTVSPKYTDGDLTVGGVVGWVDLSLGEHYS